VEAVQTLKLIKAPVVKKTTQKLVISRCGKTYLACVKEHSDHNKMALLSLGEEYDTNRIRTARSVADSKSI
jgi:hypothetical protein